MDASSYQRSEWDQTLFGAAEGTDLWSFEDTSYPSPLETPDESSSGSGTDIYGNIQQHAVSDLSTLPPSNFGNHSLIGFPQASTGDCIQFHEYDLGTDTFGALADPFDLPLEYQVPFQYNDSSAEFAIPAPIQYVDHRNPLNQPLSPVHQYEKPALPVSAFDIPEVGTQSLAMGGKRSYLKRKNDAYQEQLQNAVPATGIALESTPTGHIYDGYNSLGDLITEVGSDRLIFNEYHGQLPVVPQSSAWHQGISSTRAPHTTQPMPNYGPSYGTQSNWSNLPTPPVSRTPSGNNFSLPSSHTPTGKNVSSSQISPASRIPSWESVPLPSWPPAPVPASANKSFPFNNETPATIKKRAQAKELSSHEKRYAKLANSGDFQETPMMKRGKKRSPKFVDPSMAMRVLPGQKLDAEVLQRAGFAHATLVDEEDLEKERVKAAKRRKITK